jgi:hypothetical protein
MGVASFFTTFFCISPRKGIKSAEFRILVSAVRRPIGRASRIEYRVVSHGDFFWNLLDDEIVRLYNT